MLSVNDIYKIDQHAFEGMTVLETLDISNNSLISAPSILGLKLTLQTLILSWNNISVIHDAYFESCHCLEAIELNGNQLNVIPNVKGVAHTLRYLRLAFNNITDAKPLYNVHMPYLKTLDLHTNQIKSFCFPSVTPYLQGISLSSNRLSMLYFSQFNATSLNEVQGSLEHNPWHCNGSLGWTKQCMSQPQGYMLCMGWLFTKEIVCTSPLEVQDLAAREAGRGISPRL